MSKKLNAGVVTNMRKHILEGDRQVELAIRPIYHGGTTDKKIEKKLLKASELLATVDALLLTKMNHENFVSPKTKR